MIPVKNQSKYLLTRIERLLPEGALYGTLVIKHDLRAFDESGGCRDGKSLRWAHPTRWCTSGLATTISPGELAKGNEAY